jgi:hypothetical protein
MNVETCFTSCMKFKQKFQDISKGIGIFLMLFIRSFSATDDEVFKAIFDLCSRAELALTH